MVFMVLDVRSGPKFLNFFGPGPVRPYDPTERLGPGYGPWIPGDQFRNLNCSIWAWRHN